MATLATLRTKVAQDLRDASNETWDVAELDDYINAGIDALADFYPREIVTVLGTVSQGVRSYDASAFTNIYRIDLYTSAGDYRAEVPHGVGEGANSGWELHAGVIWMPPSWPLTSGDTLEARGYGRYVELTASSQTTDVDASGIFAVREYCKAAGFAALQSDRMRYQQWQSDAQNTDIDPNGVAQYEQMALRQWEAQKQRLRRLRKTG